VVVGDSGPGVSNTDFAYTLHINLGRVEADDNGGNDADDGAYQSAREFR